MNNLRPVQKWESTSGKWIRKQKKEKIRIRKQILGLKKR